MQTPTQAARQRRDSAGSKLPQPWSAADDLKVHFRRGQLAMVVAAPGVGKSMFANAYVIESDVRTLYLSMDTDGFTMSVRLVANRTGKTLAEAEKLLAERDPEAIQAISAIRNLTLAFPSNPDAIEIGLRLHAYREAMGEFPDILVIDNLQNIGVGEDEFGGQVSLMRDLQSVAVQTHTAILVLHHATGEHDDGDNILPQSGIRGKLSKFPALILTLHRPMVGQLGVSVVKNRFGPADASGVGTRFYLSAELEKARITDLDNSTTGYMI